MGSQGNISSVAASKLVASSSGPNIVKDGLTVLLDSRSKRSYPGSGDTWFDLSGNNNHATLNNFSGPPLFNVKFVPSVPYFSDKS